MEEGKKMIEEALVLVERKMATGGHAVEATGQRLGRLTRLFVALHRCNRLVETGIDVAALQLFGAGSGETCMHVTRQETTYLYAPRRDLTAQGLSETAEGGLGGRIETLERDAKVSSQTADYQDTATLLTAHQGKNALHHVDCPEKVDLHLTVHLVGTGELDGASDAHTSIAYQDIDTTLSRSDLSNDLPTIGGKGDVALTMDDPGCGTLVTGHLIDPTPPLGKIGGRGLADARRTASNQNNLSNHNETFDD